MNQPEPIEENDIKLPKNPFSYIALWQFLTFIMLLLLIWFNEINDMQSLVFKTRPEDMNIFRGCILTAGVFLTAMIAIGHTYVQQKRVVRALISVCSNCHRVQVRRNVWEKIEDYISDHSLLTFTHGLCPICMAEVMQTIEHRSEANKETKTNPSA